MSSDWAGTQESVKCIKIPGFMHCAVLIPGFD